MTSPTASRLARICIEPGGKPDDSLSVCVRAILRAFDINASCQFGLSPAYDAQAVHAYLSDFAARCGLEFRELHPPDAAPLPPAPREFDWHFRDSYLPFIRAALERDDPVLVWMGWPAPYEKEWGIITRIDPATGRCFGWTRGGIQRLNSSPILIYVAGNQAAISDSPNSDV